MTDKNYPYKYTQEDWSRTIGYGKVPEKYRKKDEDGTSTDKRHQRSDRSTTD